MISGSLKRNSDKMEGLLSRSAKRYSGSDMTLDKPSFIQNNENESNDESSIEDTPERDMFHGKYKMNQAVNSLFLIFIT